MSEVKFSPNLFLEKQELDRLKKFLDTDGFRNFLIQESDSFGLIKKDNAPFINALVQEDTGLTVKINAIKAIDSNGKLISSPAISQLVIPATSSWYWLKIAYQTTTVETGTFSIDSLGNLVCTSGDAELKTILRGQPNYPSRIEFTNAINNILSYDVLEVIDQNNAVLQGSFTGETGLKIAVVGTFTPGYVPLTSEKFIFQYDSCLLTLVLSNTINTPTHTSGIEFIIGRVKNDGATLKIEDKRTEIWTTDSNYFLKNLEISANPLIGVEQITYDDSLSTKVQNLVQVAWAFKAVTYSINLKLNKITITSGTGGIFKDLTLFASGNFDGWRLYTIDGKYYKIITSTLVSGNIELAMDTLNSTSFFSDTSSTVAITQSLIVAPNVEEIEIICTPDPASLNFIVDKKFTFLINEASAKIPLNVYASTGTTYNIKYRYKHLKEYSPTFVINSDTVGPYLENQFDSEGTLIVGPTRTPYVADQTNGFIPLKLNINAYNNFANRIDLGDLLGVKTSLLSNSTPIVELEVGLSRQYQYFSDGDSSVSNDQLTLLADMFIDLKKTNVDGNSCKNGNFFLLHFKQSIILNGFKLRIVTDYVSPTTFTLLKEFTLKDEIFLANSEEGIFIRAEFDDNTSWILNSVNESKWISTYSQRKRTLPAISPGASGAITYSDVLTFDILPYGLDNVFFNVGFYLTTSSGGGGFPAIAGLAIRVNGVNLSTPGDTVNSQIVQDYFLTNQTLFVQFCVKISSSLNRGDIVKIMFGAAASFSPPFTVESVSAEMIGDIIK